MTESQAVDSTAAADPNQLAVQRLVQWPYSGGARPAQAWFDACRALGVAPTVMIWETYSQRSQGGPGAGAADVARHESYCDERQHTGANAVVVSDGNSRDAWDCSGYAQGWASGARRPFFPYGSSGCCASFRDAVRGHPLLVDGDWIPETWGAGSVASQLVGAQAPLSIPHDLNRVFYDFGAPAPATKEIPDMLFKAQGASTTNPAVTDGSVWAIVGYDFVHADSLVGQVPVLDVDGEQLGTNAVALQAAKAAALGTVPAPMAPSLDVFPLHDIAAYLAAHVA